MPDSNKNQALDNIKERFALEVSDDYIKKALGKKWRDHKSTLKKLYFKKDISLKEKLGNVPPGMLRYQWEDAVRFWSSKKGEEKLKEKKAEYEAIASTDSFANLKNIDNRIINEVLGPERYGQVRFQGSGVTPTQYFGSGSQQYMPSGS
ncbi:Choline dehydrogenase [Gossypium arboreum]|uniref:Choline dehydrogenase n=1 Tax=Gossypium arboreum TaxID=29729 RepID=A0A0B0NZL7_GOSAR|nr:Choline dehydrogenase [Gossypium arboreum]